MHRRREARPIFPSATLTLTFTNCRGVAIDGKVLRRFFDRARDVRSNEIAQAPKLLRRLTLKGAIAAADASNWPAWQIPGKALSYYR